MTNSDIIRIAQECGMGQVHQIGDGQYWGAYFADKPKIFDFGRRLRAATIAECAAATRQAILTLPSDHLVRRDLIHEPCAAAIRALEAK